MALTFDERIDAAEAKIKALNENLKRLNATKKERERKVETRKKILIGALYLKQMEKDENYKKGLLEMLEKILKAPRDREIFGFPPLPSVKKEKTARADSKKSPQNAPTETADSAKNQKTESLV